MAVAAGRHVERIQLLNALRRSTAPRGERDVVELLQWYSVPLTITLDDAAIQMAPAEEVVAVVGNQVKHQQAEGFVRSVELVGETTVLTTSTALRREELARRRADDSAIDHVKMTQRPCTHRGRETKGRGTRQRSADAPVAATRHVNARPRAGRGFVEGPVRL